MAKSSKKSAPKVEAAPAVVPPSKAVKKGKRESEDNLEKIVITKKQKREKAVEQASQKKKAEAKTQAKKEETSNSEESDSSDSEEEKRPAKKPVPASNGTIKKPANKESSSSSEDSSSDDEKPATKVTTVAKKSVPAKNGAVNSDSSDEDSDDDDSEESDDEPQNKKVKVPKVPSNAKASSDDEDSSDEEPSKTLKPSKDSKKDSSESEEGSEDESSSEEESEDLPKKTSMKMGSDVEMVDAMSPITTKQADKKAPRTPATPETGSKTLFVGNLSFSVEQADVENFFKDAGEVVDVRFATNEDGAFKGFGHVEFATHEAAKKALELNGQELLGRVVRLDMARERGAYTPNDSKEGNSFQSKGKGQGQTVFVRGFDKFLGEDEIRSSLQEHFGSCGEITRISIPKDYETGSAKGMAYMDFSDADSFNKALELNGGELGGYSLTVEEAKPRGDFGSGGRGGGGRSGGRGGGGRSGGRDFGGRSGGRDFGGRSGGRRGGGRGGFGGRGGGRGRGNKPNLAAAGTGKKTTFGDD